MAFRFSKTIAACSAVALLSSPSAATAKSASSLGDLVGARAAGGEQELESRGFVVTDGHKGSDASFAYWWNAKHHDCVMVTTRDGKYASIVDTKPSDCNQKSGDGSGAAVVGAVAVGAIIGAALLAHKAGHHDDGKHFDDADKEADYERGYRDGLYQQPYHNYGRSDSYSSGYENGVEQRARETSHRDDHQNGAGYAASVDVSDLSGARAAGAMSDLESRGFRNVASFQSGSDAAGTVWWNGRTKQCLQFLVVDGRVDAVTDIGTHPGCR